MRKAIVALGMTAMLAVPLYGQTAQNLDVKVQQYLAPVQSLFHVDMRALYAKAKQTFSKMKKDQVPNPFPLVLHEPLEELLNNDAPPVLIDAVEAHLNQLARFRAEQEDLGTVLRNYDPAESIIAAYDFGDIKDVRYTTNARISADGHATSGLLTYFTFAPEGGQAREYRIIVPIVEVEKVTEQDVTYIHRTYNKVLGVLQVRNEQGEWKDLNNPTLERMKNTPQRKSHPDPLLPDASQSRIH